MHRLREVRAADQRVTVAILWVFLDADQQPVLARRGVAKLADSSRGGAVIVDTRRPTAEAVAPPFVIGTKQRVKRGAAKPWILRGRLGAAIRDDCFQLLSESGEVLWSQTRVADCVEH